VTDENIDVVQFNDGTTISYDSSSKALAVECAGTIHISASGNVSVTTAADCLIQATGTLFLEAAAIKIKGPVTQTGGDMTSDGVSAQGHKHDKVKAGVDKSGEPVK
jgi:phage baseplate assembly protein V